MAWRSARQRRAHAFSACGGKCELRAQRKLCPQLSALKYKILKNKRFRRRSVSYKHSRSSHTLENKLKNYNRYRLMKNVD